MSDSKKQSLIVIGISMIIIAGILLYFALSQPKYYVDVNATTAVPATSAATADFNGDNTEHTTTSSSVNTVSYPLNINTCTAEELTTIDGIGDKTASAIIEYRGVLGGYTSLEQIKEIKGIGEGTYEKISPYLCL